MNHLNSKNLNETSYSKEENIFEIKRLDVVKSLVPEGTRLLDVGTDHASLPIDLVRDGIIKYAIASDVNVSPLERASMEISKNGFSESIKTVLSNGFENISKDDFDTAAICGMGGHLIAEIINKGKDKVINKNLILQPMSYPEALRKYLFDNGFEIQNEVFAYDNNKPYVIILTKYTGVNTIYSYGDLLFGKIRPLNKFYYLYERKIVKRLQKRLIGILKSKSEQMQK